jgi:hypothetical protein
MYCDFLFIVLVYYCINSVMLRNNNLPDQVVKYLDK